MSGRQKVSVTLLWVLLINLTIGAGSRTACAVRENPDFQILKQALEKPGTGVIVIKRNIRMSGAVYVRGEKVLLGNGHLLERESRSGGVYGGNLFVIRNASLTMQDVVISGGGGKKALRGNIFGRLVDVGQGKFILEKKSVLKDNRNTDRTTDGGGAVRVQKNGSFEMRGGRISGNKNVTGGAGICIENGGKAVIRGGEISQNQVQGMGRVEGFDGRGGAISNRGNLRIEGGSFRKNRAVSYAGKQADYGGVGGMLYNEGICRIAGGTISGNKASMVGDGIYAAKGADTEISGGTIKNKVYLQKGAVLKAAKTLSLKQTITLEPQYYQCGQYVVRKGKKSSFCLEKKEGFLLKEDQKGLYIAKRKPKKNEMPQKKEQKKRKIIFSASPKRLKFYEGEYVGRKTLCFGIQAKDREGNVPMQIRVERIIYENRTERRPRKLNTSSSHNGVIVYQAILQDGRKVPFRRAFCVISNQAPEIKAAPRYLFEWEAQRYSEKKWREVLLSAIRVEDDMDSGEALKEKMTIRWNGLLENRAGSYEVEAKVRDQRGYRYYMGAEEKRRYGRGKESYVSIPVTLVAGKRTGENQKDGCIRFLPISEKEKPAYEEWHFSRKEIQASKVFMGQWKNPFSTEANRSFYQRFSHCFIGKVVE